MGNQGSQLGDEPSTVAQRNLQHFDHTFKAELHTTHGPYTVSAFGECQFAKRAIVLTCKGMDLDILEDISISEKNTMSLSYSEVSAVSWDHANSEVKIVFYRDDTENFFIFTLANSIEFETELKLRFVGAVNQNRAMKIPSTMYIGMFAGANKPKPFQRKRPNLSRLPAGKLPPLQDMRNMAIELHRGSYKPCPQGKSRREQIGLQHIYEGVNSFLLLSVRGSNEVMNQYRADSNLVITDESLIFRPKNAMPSQEIQFLFENIVDWTVVDNEHKEYGAGGGSGLEVLTLSGETVFFGVAHVRDVKHSLEYFWNTFKVENGQADAVKLGSTHGRPIVSATTLSGEMPPPEAPVGQVEVVDQDGLLVRPGGRIVRRGSIATGKLTTSKDPKVVPPENRDVKPHWHKVVMHQGWLLKQGGVGVGNIKSWIKRYFVLYKTSQGHFLVYYSDFTECPMYTAERNHRNLVDLAKATFIRPGSNKSENNPDVPPHSFDIVTTEREWTLCAESQENAQKWLKLLTRAVDEDVAILPDEELVFKVKPKMDPLGVLPVSDYSTSLKVSAHGISVTVPDTNSKDSSAEREVYFWVYTDFYKWSLLSQAGKLALLVNVFADASFSRRNEYIFRNKEAQRLATAIEFFIEKFMTLMHIRIETQEGAFDEEPVDQNNNNEETNELKAVSSGLHMMNAQEDQLDLLGLDLNDDQGGSVSPFGSSANLSPGLTSTPSAPVGEFQNSDPFGSTPFGEEPAPTPPTVPASQPPGNLENSPFGAADPFGADPFGFDNASPSPAVKVAPPLTPAQQQQHNQWLTAAMANNGGPLYSDGTLQIATQIEIRGSQGRVTFMYNNQSPAKLSNFVVSVEDPSGLLRVQLSPFPDNGEIAGLHKTTQVLMAECMKPAYPGPKLKISYLDSLHGKRENTINLPIVVTTFNERLALSWEDYASRWHLLVGEGQEVQEILKPSFPIQTEQISAALVSPLKFGIVRQEPQPAPMVIYGAATLRTGAMNAAGEKISVGCLAKIELNPQANALRVTLRTVHPSASKAILETVKSLFI